MPASAAPWDTPENAVAYARFCRRFPYRRDAAASLARFARAGHATRLADLGCGTGQSTRALARSARKARVIGVDPAAAMLAEARRGTRSKRVTYVEGDAARLPLLAAGGAFDAVTCVSALWLAETLEATLADVRAALRPGGQLVFSLPAELVGEVDHLLQSPAASFFRALAEARAAAGLPAPEAVPVKVPVSLEGWEALLDRAGFRGFRTELVSARVTVAESVAHLAIPAVAASYLPGASPAQVAAVLTRFEQSLGPDAPALLRRWRHVAVSR